MENERGYKSYGALSRERFGSEGSTRNAFSYVIDTNSKDIASRSNVEVKRKKNPALPPKFNGRHRAVRKPIPRAHDWNESIDPKLNAAYEKDSSDPRLLFQSSNNRVNENKNNEDNRHQSSSLLFGSKLIDLEKAAPVPTDAERENLLKSTFLKNYHSSIQYEDTKQLQEELRNQRDSDIEIFSKLANPEDAHDISKETSAERETFKQKAMVFLREKIYEELVYNEATPEFSTKQQITWACLIGILMGIYTALWSDMVETLVEFVWKDVPETLRDWGMFTDLDGPFPLPHYMWICPTVFGGVLSFITIMLPFDIPGQNEWIDAVHRKGLMEWQTLPAIFFLSTAGMASGLSLGPELPLVLTAGMMGSYIARNRKQSLLQSRVLNLTAASAAIGGFFGFPMAGALFVLELPHPMGLQYFEALNPAVVASIVAVLVNRMVTQNDVTGYFNYPFLTDTLPAHIFYIAVIYGIVGSVFGVLYARGCYNLKSKTHNLFHSHDHHDEGEEHKEEHNKSESYPGIEFESEKLELPLSGNKFILETKKRPSSTEIARVTGIGIMAGFLVGIISMFYPHNLFWGEAQLQTLIDNGTTLLPVFGRGEEKTADLIAYGHCMPEEGHSEDFQFSIGCSAILVVTKILVIGLSLGTGIIGGHFWGPLYVGAAGANLFTSLMASFFSHLNVAKSLSSYPSLALICIMGATHVVTFKANMAIMLILTLTISSFNPFGDNDLNTGGDYSAVFPLLVVSVFISMMLTRSTHFYKQSNRCDLIITKQSLCIPSTYADVHMDASADGSEASSDSSLSLNSLGANGGIDDNYDLKKTENGFVNVRTTITSESVEQSFNENLRRQNFTDSQREQISVEDNYDDTFMKLTIGSTEPNFRDGRNIISDTSVISEPKKPSSHRRIQSADVSSFVGFETFPKTTSLRKLSTGNRPRADSNSSKKSKVFGEITVGDMQLDIMSQGRKWAATNTTNMAKTNNGRRGHRRSSSLNVYGTMRTL